MSARRGESREFFVIEADEYDTAFFDKRSKFVHYRPRTAVLNNLEYDHADIFPDLAAIETQFHHLVRTVPAPGACWSSTAGEESLARVLAARPRGRPGRVLQSRRILRHFRPLFPLLDDKPSKAAHRLFAGEPRPDSSPGLVFFRNSAVTTQLNALAAIAAARHAGRGSRTMKA